MFDNEVYTLPRSTHLYNFLWTELYTAFDNDLSTPQAEVKKARTDCEASGQKRIAFETFLPIYLSVQVGNISLLMLLIRYPVRPLPLA